MADSSITAGPILDPIAEDCWARRRLRGGIRYVSVASKPMNPPTLLRVVFLQHYIFDKIVNIPVIQLPMGLSPLQAGELKSSELSRVLAEGQNGR